MIPERRALIDEEAIGWVVRLREADSAAWEEFTAWLEADPAHAAAYDEIAADDADWDALSPPDRHRIPRAIPGADSDAEARPLPGVGADPSGHRFGRRRLLGGAVAAAIVGLVGYGTLAPDRSVYAIETQPGERRSVALADGSRIHLNGSTRISLDRDAPRYARVEQGEALFTVVHDSARPFEVEAGDAVLRDMGTVFNVVRDANGLEVGVAEGAVLFNPDEEAVNLTPGMVLRRNRGEAARVTRRAPEAVATWREGRLVYASATVGRVASDLTRNLGVTVAASASVEQRPFTGVIVLDAEPERTVDRAASLLGVQADRSEEGWVLKTGGGETR